MTTSHPMRGFLVLIAASLTACSSEVIGPTGDEILLAFPPPILNVGVADTAFNNPSQLEVRGDAGVLRITGMLSIPAPCYGVVASGRRFGRYVEARVAAVMGSAPSPEPCAADAAGRSVEIGWGLEAGTYRVVVLDSTGKVLVDGTIRIR